MTRDDWDQWGWLGMTNDDWDDKGWLGMTRDDWDYYGWLGMTRDYWDDWVLCNHFESFISIMEHNVWSQYQTIGKELKIWCPAGFFLPNLKVVHFVFDEILSNLLLFHYFKNNFQKEQLQIQRCRVFHLISKQSLNFSFLGIFCINVSRRSNANPFRTICLEISFEM